MLLLIINRRSYTGSQLPPNLMTSDELKRSKIQRFVDFFLGGGNFGLRDTFQKRIAPKPIETDIEKLHTKFSTLNVDFDGPILDFLGSRRPVHEGIK